MKSLRTRLVLLTMLGTIIVLASTGWIVLTKHSEQLSHLFNASLQAIATDMSGSLLHTDHIVSVASEGGQNKSLHEALQTLHSVQVFSLDGTLIYENRLEESIDASPFLDELKDDAVSELTDESGSRFRSYMVPVKIGAFAHFAEHELPGNADETMIDGLLVVSARSGHIYEQTHSLALLILRISLLSTVLAGVFAWFAVGYGLRPLGALARRISETTPETLNTKIEAQGQPSEIVPVVDRLNDLLGRLDEALVRERTLSTNVAHELRTPVAALISTLEVRLKDNVGPQDEKILRECLSVTQGMQAVVSSLLTLSRLESGQMKGELTDNSLVELMNDVWSSVAHQGVTLCTDATEGIVLQADQNLLRIALSNALSNAARHAPGGSAVTVTLSRTSTSVLVSVKNNGCTLKADEASLVFDRFWRHDESRTDTNVHCGLGATLIRQATEAAGGSATAEVDGGTFTLYLTYPVLTAPKG